jgi:hypothetical protein
VAKMQEIVEKFKTGLEELAEESEVAEAALAS